MQPTFLKTLLILSLIAGLAAPAFAADERSPATEQTSMSKQAKAEVKVEKSAAKEESKPAVVIGPDEKGPELTDRKTFRGEISGISSNFLALEISADATAAREMTFKVSKDVRLIGRDKIMDFKNGDTVSVLCEETTQSVTKKDKAGKDIKEVKVLGRVVKEITLMKAAPEPEPEVVPVVEPELEDEPETTDASAQPGEAGE